MKTVGMLVIHNDDSLLFDSLRSVQNYIDCLVVVDGAYRWVAPICEILGENPERSNDKLLDICHSFPFPVEYHSGIWENELDKRIFSMESAKSNRIISIDSDDHFDLSQDTIEQFFASGKAIGQVEYPLFLHNDIVTRHRATGSFTGRSVFIDVTHLYSKQISVKANDKNCKVHTLVHHDFGIERYASKVDNTTFSLDSLGNEAARRLILEIVPHSERSIAEVTVSVAG